ncbi:hypothetical protein AHAS_Ahas03G0137400 [Arachis hypogaea]
MHVHSSRSYFVSIVVNIKDQLVKLVKILITFTIKDLSNNLFVGSISHIIESVTLFHKLWIT